ncbi:hypothetical protein INR49_018012 [Caranx melampygus]|nr:hypothetical protein INR49_018012 [Caranx melampygus]
MVIVTESDTFDFVFPDNEELSMPSVRRVSVGRESGASVLVPIRPKVLGEIPISVKALSAAPSDLVRRTVLVKAEGLEQTFSTSLLFEVSPSQPVVTRHITFTLPADVVDGSVRAELTAVGYERELSYQRVDGSFSAFGDQDSSGSTWFEEPGRVIHTELQGGQDGPVSLTAYVLIALLEDGDIRAQYGSQVSAALLFLETRLALGIPGNYSLSLVVYALALSGSSSADLALSELIGRAEMKDGVPTWSSSGAGLSSSWQPRSADVEMAAYVLLAQHRLGHDTVVALQALSTFAVLGASHDYDLIISVNSSFTSFILHIQQDNYLVQQSQQVELEQDLSLEVTAHGRGLALVQLNVFYNIRTEQLTKRKRRRRMEVGSYEAFDLYVELFDSEINSAHLYVCWSLREDAGLNSTGMAILELGLLSGFVLPPDGVQTNEVVKKVETRPGAVILYLDSVLMEEMCLTVPLLLEHKVAKVQDASVLLYDYYEPRRRAVRTYESSWRRDTSSCSFCGPDCSECRADGHYELSAASHSFLSTRSPPALLLPLLVFIIAV